MGRVHGEDEDEEAEAEEVEAADESVDEQRIGYAKHLLSFVLDGKYDMARVMLEQQADPNVADAEGDTALHYAAAQGREDLVSLLICHGTDPTTRNWAAWTALDAALLLHPENRQLATTCALGSPSALVLQED